MGTGDGAQQQRHELAFGSKHGGGVIPHAQNATWETVSVPGICTFQIPPTVEIQAGAYKRYNDQLTKTILEITESPDRAVAQPKGINAFNPVALNRYWRIIVETEKGLPEAT